MVMVRGFDKVIQWAVQAVLLTLFFHTICLPLFTPHLSGPSVLIEPQFLSLLRGGAIPLGTSTGFWSPGFLSAPALPANFPFIDVMAPQ